MGNTIWVNLLNRSARVERVARKGEVWLVDLVTPVPNARPLHRRERTALELTACGYSYKQIALEFCVSIPCARAHVLGALHKTGLALRERAIWIAAAAAVEGAGAHFDRGKHRDSAVAQLEVRPVREVVECLTAGEREIAFMVVDGKSNGVIARERRAALRTVANQLASIYRKFGLASRGELVHRLFHGLAVREFSPDSCVKQKYWRLLMHKDSIRFGSCGVG